ncbi:NAD-dependent epimerase/dehydratase family protein [Streptomyces armeniacus]|uniref:NAD-dependent epimerase/dehydratase family protein n=1 Tax=Streptomyces armeniacus TaxID=83291 RepID=A0A345XP15_9ACTN|nr:NAD(P)H-binding protein [Streptomyces armeniacus]AXK33381.1 NAD-dependent epimerase/dehydratase family protein [Streptomyces armeniacus]
MNTDSTDSTAGAEGTGGAGGTGGAAPGRPVLVTGGTGTLGRQVVRRLLDRQRAVRVMSRRARPAGDRAPYEWASCDLAKGRGIDAAVAGVDTIVHCATTLTGDDEAAARRLLGAVRESDTELRHFVYVSIVGIDRVPLGYYRRKLAAEGVLESSGLPYTVLRTTQFHDLIALMATCQRRLPVVFTLSGVSFQPVDSGEVADRLVELAQAEPAGRVADMGGPEVRTARDLARSTLDAYVRRRRVVPLRLPGRAFGAYRAGGHLAPERAVGRLTFEDHLAATGGSAGRPAR